MKTFEKFKAWCRTLNGQDRPSPVDSHGSSDGRSYSKASSRSQLKGRSFDERRYVPRQASQPRAEQPKEPAYKVHIGLHLLTWLSIYGVATGL